MCPGRERRERTAKPPLLTQLLTGAQPKTGTCEAVLLRRSRTARMSQMKETGPPLPLLTQLLTGAQPKTGTCAAVLLRRSRTTRMSQMEETGPPLPLLTQLLTGAQPKTGTCEAVLLRRSRTAPSQTRRMTDGPRGVRMQMIAWEQRAACGLRVAFFGETPGALHCRTLRSTPVAASQPCPRASHPRKKGGCLYPHARAGQGVGPPAEPLALGTDGKGGAAWR